MDIFCLQEENTLVRKTALMFEIYF